MNCRHAMPRVSVTVPAFNAEQHLAQAIECVHAQTYEDWEVVVADDGSTDATSGIAGGFGPRVRVVRQPANRGVGAALELAVSHSTGELVAVLAADDYWLPDYLEEQVAL
jgi:glycosyltransferase involved in cell wall biosynthesis